MAGAFFWNPSPGRGSWLPNWFCREPLIEGFSMILVFYFVVGSHFGFLRLLFCSEFGGTLLDGLVFCREPFSTKSPVSTLAWNEQGDPFVRACNLCNPPILPCPGKAKLGEDHPQTLHSLNNMAALLKAQGRLADAEPLYREALEKSPGAQLQRFQWDFGQWIWSHTLLDLRRVIRFLMTGTGAAMLLGYLRMVLACFRQKFPKLLSFQSTSWQIPWNCKVHWLSLISVWWFLVIFDYAGSRLLWWRKNGKCLENSKVHWFLFDVCRKHSALILIPVIISAYFH